jgi:hypothetical protein
VSFQPASQKFLGYKRSSLYQCVAGPLTPRPRPAQCGPMCGGACRAHPRVKYVSDQLKVCVLRECVQGLFSSRRERRAKARRPERAARGPKLPRAAAPKRGKGSGPESWVLSVMQCNHVFVTMSHFFSGEFSCVIQCLV